MSDPFKIDGPTCISFSGGRTSAYMLHRVLESNGGLPKEAVVLFANTGKEEEATLRFVQDCSEKWSVPITWLEYVGDDRSVDAVECDFIAGLADPQPFKTVDFDTAARGGQPYDAIIAHRGHILPNIRSAYCSSELKTRTMHRYLRSVGWTEWDSMVGIRADETVRASRFRANPSPETPSEEIVMPLVADGVTKATVAEFWDCQPFRLGLRVVNGIVPEGNCDLCFKKPEWRIVSLIAAKPSRAIWWARNERQAEAFATGDGARFALDRATYAQMAAFTKAQQDAFGHGDEEAIPCFCGD